MWLPPRPLPTSSTTRSSYYSSTPPASQPASPGQLGPVRSASGQLVPSDSQWALFFPSPLLSSPALMPKALPALPCPARQPSDVFLPAHKLLVPAPARCCSGYQSAPWILFEWTLALCTLPSSRFRIRARFRLRRSHRHSLLQPAASGNNLRSALPPLAIRAKPWGGLVRLSRSKEAVVRIKHPLSLPLLLLARAQAYLHQVFFSRK